MFWSVTTALLAFMGLLKNHPVLGALNSNVYAKITLAAAWLISGSLFLIFWWREQLTEKRIDYLMSEECLVETFDSLCRTATWTDDESAGTFTTSDFADCLNEEATYGLSWFRKLVRGKREIDPTAATDVARTHLTVLEERKAVLRLMEPSASPKFQIHPDILTPLKERHEDNKRRQREKAGQEKAEKETEQNSPETET